MIEIVNLLPPEQDLPELSVDNIEHPDLAEKELELHLQALPKSFREYVWSYLSENHQNREEALNRAIGNYQRFVNYRKNLRIIIKLSQAGPDDFITFMDEVWGQYWLNISKDGKVKISTDFFADAVQGVEASRIRECQACHRIFWAGRSKQQGCTKACANRIRVRKWRQNYQEKYKLQRTERADQKGQQRSTAPTNASRKNTKKGEK